MVFKFNTIFEIIVAILVISGAILDKSQAIEQSTLEDSSTPAALSPAKSNKDECYKNLTTNCSSLIFANCDDSVQGIGVPYSYLTCCFELLKVTDDCFYDVILKEDTCKTRAEEIWNLCPYFFK